MPVYSQYLAILQNIQAQIFARGLRFNGQQVPVLIKKVGRWLQGIGLQNLPVILIAPDQKPYSVQPWSSEDEVLVKYNCSLVSLAAGNQDNTANMDLWLSWAEQERRLFQWGMQPQILSCFYAEVNPDPPILKDAFLKNYDVSGLGFCFWNVEPRTN